MLKRHTILFLTDVGSDFAWEHQEFAYPGREKLQIWRKDFSKLPAIVRRERAVQTQIPIGVSFPVYKDENRWKLSSVIPRENAFIERIIAPEQAAFQCAKQNTKHGKFVREAIDAASKNGISLGIFGSAALGAVTGFPYLHTASDLDLIAEAGRGADLWGFETALESLEEKFKLRTDTEISLGNGYYGKLKELLSGQKTILAKGDLQPQLLLCRAVIERLGTTG